MAVASVSTPIAPPRASISRTICPLATPPIAGLQLIWPTVSQLIVSRAVPQPHPGRGQRRLEPGMAGTHDDDIKSIGVVLRRHDPLIRGRAAAKQTLDQGRVDRMQTPPRLEGQNPFIL